MISLLTTFLCAVVLFVQPKASSQTDAKQCDGGIETDFLVELVSYSNTLLGAFHDHYATTWTHLNHAKSLRGYYKVDSFGLIANSSEPVNASRHRCECLQEVVQMLDEQPGLGGTSSKPGLFGRLDHKLVHVGEESNALFERYARTGERLYCVAEYGQCGASVPLYRWFSSSEIDNLITIRDSFESDRDANLKPLGILCYIWPLDYRSGADAPALPHPSFRPASVGVVATQNMPSGFVAGAVPVLRLPPPPKPDLVCPPLSTTNGHWAYTLPARTPGTIAFLNCHSGYTTSNVSATAVICQRTAHWLPDPTATCQLSGCAAIDEPSSSERGRVVYTSSPVDTRLYPVGTTAMLVCPERTDVSHKGADVAYCSAAGVWQPKGLGRCERVCPFIMIENGRVVYSDAQGMDQITNTNGTIATLICGGGTQLVGHGTTVCVDGEWQEARIGECRELKCPVLQGTQHGKLTYIDGNQTPMNPFSFKIAPGTVARLHCEDGRFLRGAGESICHSSERWQPELGSCM